MPHKSGKKSYAGKPGHPSKGDGERKSFARPSVPKRKQEASATNKFQSRRGGKK